MKRISVICMLIVLFVGCDQMQSAEDKAKAAIAAHQDEIKAAATLIASAQDVLAKLTPTVTAVPVK